MKIKIIILYLLIISLGHSFWLSPAAATDVGVLVDISGSMRILPANQAKTLLAAIILEGRVPDGWQVSPKKQGNLLAQQFAQGTGESLLKKDDRFLFMVFGDIIGDRFPYFQQPWTIAKIQDMEEVRRLIDSRYPHTFNEHYTYDDLCHAVAAKKLRDLGSNHFYLVVVSDFQTEYNRKRQPTPEMRRLNNDFRLKNSFQWETLLILNNSEHQNLEVRINEVRTNEKPPEPNKLPLKVEILIPKGETQDRRPQFEWESAAGSPLGASHYVVKCFREAEKIFEENEVRDLQLACPQELAPGEYEWLVTPYVGDVAQDTTSKAQFSVIRLDDGNDTGGNWWLWFILVVILAGGGLAYQHRKKLLKFLGLGDTVR